MWAYVDSNKSKSVLHYPLQISKAMVTVIGRRRFIILLFICCVSFIIFGWYMRTEDLKNLNEMIFSKKQETTNPLIENWKKSGIKVGFPTSGDVHIKKQFIEFPKDNRNFQEKVSTTPAKKVLKVTKSDQRHQDDDDLFSGPTEDDQIVTMPSDMYDVNDELFSGPTEYEEMEVTIPSNSYPEEELNSGPTEDDQVGVTIPVKVEDFSGPTEDMDTVVPATGSSNVVVETKDVVTEKEDDLTTPNGAGFLKPPQNPSLILDTDGCKVPKLNPWDPSIISLIATQAPYECPGPPLFMKSQPDGSISLNESVLEDHYRLLPEEVICHYQSIHRKHEDPGNVRENDYYWGNVTKLKFGVPLNQDYVGVSCKMGNNKKEFQQYFPLVRLREDIERERSAISPPAPRLNIILAGIDSVSKLNFLRHFPRTHKFLKEKLSPFVMNGYTKVGDNTFPNLVPMLTGHFVEHYWNESVRDTMYFDEVSLIWKDYAKKGYRTFYAEDSPHTGTFNYIKRGFYDPPTDYYIRPLHLALESSKVRENSKAHCLNSQIETDIIYDYLRDFVAAMGPRPYNAFAMVSTMTHDYLNNAGYADLPTVRILEDLLSCGALNSSLLVLFSDHGLRFGKIRETYIGKFEERMPFMYIHVPKWFLEQYPELANNIRTNQNRLITLFDIHATMVHLLDLDRQMTPEEKATVTLGTSLLKKISPNRTCDEANILAHWCPCQTYEAIPADGTAATKASQALVDNINTQLQPYGDDCSVLEVDNILSAGIGKANDLVLKFVRHDNVVVDRKVVYGDKIEPIADYLITLVAKPGGAVFEGTIRHDPMNDIYTVLGISRINLYGTTSWCIDSQKMKIFCYCKIQKQ